MVVFWGMNANKQPVVGPELVRVWGSAFGGGQAPPSTTSYRIMFRPGRFQYRYVVNTATGVLLAVLLYTR